jgi:hypothetical protein
LYNSLRRRIAPTPANFASFLSSLSSSFRQVFRLLCQVFPNISLAVFGISTGCASKTCFLTRIAFRQVFLSDAVAAGSGEACGHVLQVLGARRGRRTTRRSESNGQISINLVFRKDICRYFCALAKLAGDEGARADLPFPGLRLFAPAPSAAVPAVPLKRALEKGSASFSQPEREIKTSSTGNHGSAKHGFGRF